MNVVALVSPSLCLSVLYFAFSRVASVGAFMCGESMWAVGLCLPSLRKPFRLGLGPLLLLSPT